MPLSLNADADPGIRAGLTLWQMRERGLEILPEFGELCALDAETGTDNFQFVSADNKETATQLRLKRDPRVTEQTLPLPCETNSKKEKSGNGVRRFDDLTSIRYMAQHCIVYVVFVAVRRLHAIMFAGLHHE